MPKTNTQNPNEQNRNTNTPNGANYTNPLQNEFENSATYRVIHKVGDKVTLLGRFQSRAYQKQLPDGTVIGKTAYEVSVGRLTMADAAPQPAPFVIHPEETHTVETLVQPSTPVQVNPFTTPTT